MRGEVIGVATGGISEGQNLNFAIPINYLKSFKELDLFFKIKELLKSKKLKSSNNNNNLVRVFNIRYSFEDNAIKCINFSIENQTSYPISDISILFIYRNSKGEIIDYASDIFFGKGWGRAIVYKEPSELLQKLAKQTVYCHKVKFFRKRDFKTIWGLFDTNLNWTNGSVEIRVLDYSIATK